MIYFSGYFEGTVDFNPNEETAFHTSNGGVDVFIEKLYFEDVSIENNKSNITDNIFVYPNPANNLLNIIIPNEENTQIMIELININGQTIIQEQFYSNKMQLNIPEKLSGLYFVKITYNNNQVIKKIIIE